MVPEPVTFSIPGPGKVTGSLAVPLLRLRIGLPIVKALEIPAAAVPPAAAAPPAAPPLPTALPDSEAASGLEAALLKTSTPACRAPALDGLNAAENRQLVPGARGAPVHEAVPPRAN